jgi:RNA polymerase sigma-70 factor (ECF subfamily)
MTAIHEPIGPEELQPMSRETFAELLEPNLRAVRAFVGRKLLNPDHTEDILQKTLLHAFAKRHQLRVPAKFRSWLFSIAMNETRIFRRGFRPVAAMAELTASALADRAPSPLARYEQVEREERLRTAIAGLSERDRTAIRLMDLDEFSLDEAAERLAVSKSALKSTLFRARRRLAEVINPRLHDPLLEFATSGPRREAGIGL